MNGNIKHKGFQGVDRIYRGAAMDRHLPAGSCEYNNKLPRFIKCSKFPRFIKCSKFLSYLPP